MAEAGVMAEATASGTHGPSASAPSVSSPPSLRTTTWLTALVGWLLACWAALVVSTPYRYDDAINKDVRAGLAAQGLSLGGAIVRLTRQWMTNEGRFFPGSVSWSLGLFWVAGSRPAYKLVLAALLVGLVAVVGALVRRTTQTWVGAALVVPVLLGFVQIRTWYDGYTAFAGLLPLTAALTLGAFLLLLVRDDRWSCALAATMYLVALLTYETVLLFAPALLAVLVLRRRRRRAVGALAGPAVAVVVVVAYLRSTLVAPPNYAYTASAQVRPVVAATVKQLAAALPMSQWLFGAASVPPVTASSLVIGVLLGGVPAAVVTALVVRTTGRPAVRAWPLVLVGGWMWLSSSVLVGLTVRWQRELERGQGYLPVVFGEMGAALLTVGLWSVLDRRARGERWAPAWRWGSVTVISAIVSLTLAGNVAVVGSLSP